MTTAASWQLPVIPGRRRVPWGGRGPGQTPPPCPIWHLGKRRHALPEAPRRELWRPVQRQLETAWLSLGGWVAWKLVSGYYRLRRPVVKLSALSLPVVLVLQVAALGLGHG